MMREIHRPTFFFGLVVTTKGALMMCTWTLYCTTTLNLINESENYDTFFVCFQDNVCKRNNNQNLFHHTVYSDRSAKVLTKTTEMMNKLFCVITIYMVLNSLLIYERIHMLLSRLFWSVHSCGIHEYSQDKQLTGVKLGHREQLSETDTCTRGHHVLKLITSETLVFVEIT